MNGMLNLFFMMIFILHAASAYADGATRAKDAKAVDARAKDLPAIESKASPPPKATDDVTAPAAIEPPKKSPDVTPTTSKEIDQTKSSENSQPPKNNVTVHLGYLQLIGAAKSFAPGGMQYGLEADHIVGDANPFKRTVIGAILRWSKFRKSTEPTVYNHGGKATFTRTDALVTGGLSFGNKAWIGNIDLLAGIGSRTFYHVSDQSFDADDYFKSTNWAAGLRTGISWIPKVTSTKLIMKWMIDILTGPKMRTSKLHYNMEPLDINGSQYGTGIDIGIIF
jgi:hypothetical protein